MSRVRPRFKHIYGVDFSGAKEAGRNIWIAHAVPTVPDSRDATRRASAPLQLESLDCLERLAGSSAREEALAHLVGLIGHSRDALWAIDFPFGLPIEVMSRNRPWSHQLDAVRRWRRGAYDFGLWCVARAKSRHGRMHIRRTTDADVRAPFDCYHYRIIYQTFHGMRDVLAQLAQSRGTWIAPFHRNSESRRGAIHRVVVDSLRHVIEISDDDRRRIMRNPGGDALDAVIAAAGAFQSWAIADHAAIARHARYPLEGFIYA